MDLTNLKVGDKVILRNKRTATVTEVDLGSSIPFAHDGGSKVPNLVFWCERNGSCCANGLQQYDIVGIAVATDLCLWRYDRVDSVNGHHRAVWKTSCGREFDRLTAGEQPRKGMSMEYCPYCGKTISDETQDC